MTCIDIQKLNKHTTNQANGGARPTTTLEIWKELSLNKCQISRELNIPRSTIKTIIQNRGVEKLAKLPILKISDPSGKHYGFESRRPYQLKKLLACRLNTFMTTQETIVLDTYKETNNLSEIKRRLEGLTFNCQYRKRYKRPNGKVR